MQSLFGCKTAANGPGKQFNVKNGGSSTGEENVLIMDPKKSQNIAILLKALNVSKEQVCAALLEGRLIPLLFICTVLVGDIISSATLPLCFGFKKAHNRYD